MSFVITIDAGTTNSRVVLWEHEKHTVKFEISSQTGVRNTSIDGNNGRLKKSIKEALQSILKQNKLTLKNIKAIVASGMISSNLGLFELPHIAVPSGINELASAMKSELIKGVSSMPIWFIPGVKNTNEKASLSNIGKIDMMRGEECETIGLISRMRINKPFLSVFPGTHTKFVAVNSNGEITGCLTSIAGELTGAITEHTILSSTLNKALVKKINKKYLLAGFNESTRRGFISSLFSIRVLNLLGNISGERSANFLLGAVSAEDIRAVKNSKALKTDKDFLCVITGKEILKNAFTLIIKHDNYFKNILTLPPKTTNNLAGFGALAIAEKRKII